MAISLDKLTNQSTFDGLISLTNTLADIVGNNAITAVANSAGSTTSGNAVLDGILQVNTLAVGSIIRGGSLSASANLTLTSNLIVQGTILDIQSNTIVSGSNTTINSTKTTISSANLIIASNTLFNNTVTFSNSVIFNNVVTINANTVLNGTSVSIDANTTIDGSLTTNSVSVGNNLSVSGTTTLNGVVSVTANTILNNSNTTIQGGNLHILSRISSNLIPIANSTSFGNTTARWSIFSDTLNVSTSTSTANLTVTGSFANINSNAFLRADTSVLGSQLTVTSNVSIASSNTNIAGGTLNVNSIAVFNSNTTINGSNLQINANTVFSQRVTVNGDLQVTGNLTFNATSYADVIPSSTGYALGNNTNRWSLLAITGNFSGNVAVSGNLVVSGTTFAANTQVSTFTSTSIVLNAGQTGTPTTNTQITFNRGTSANTFIRWNETLDRLQATNDGTNIHNIVLENSNTYAISVSGNANTATTALDANNSTNLNGQAASFYRNANNINAGTLNNSRLAGSYNIDITGTANNSTNLNGQAASFYLNWTNFSSTPNTTVGYGITDAVTTNTTQTITGTKTFTQLDISNTSNFGTTPRQMINLLGSTYGIGVQDLVTYVRTQKGFAVFQGGTHSNTELAAGTGGTVIFAASNTSIQYMGQNVYHTGNILPITTIDGVNAAANGNISLASTYQAKSANLDVFSLRNVGTSSANSIIDRASGDARYGRLANTQTWALTQTFTESPIIPTPSAGDSSTKAATTAWAMGKAGGAFSGLVDMHSYTERRLAPSIALGVLTLPVDEANIFEINLTENITSIVFTGLPANNVFKSWLVRFNITGSHSITWPTACKHSGGVAPTLSTTAGDIATFVLYTSDAGTKIVTVYSGNNR